MPRKPLKKSRNARKKCSRSPRKKISLRSNSSLKRSRGSGRQKSLDRMNKYEKVYRNVIKSTSNSKRTTKVKSRKPVLNSYTKFVQKHISEMSGKNQAIRMKQVAKLWRKQNKSKSPRKPRKRICKHGVRRKSRVCKKKPGPKSK